MPAAESAEAIVDDSPIQVSINYGRVLADWQFNAQTAAIL
jgi:hypothetical protein